MDSKQIEAEHIVARYLADQLSPAEAEAFEAYYTEHPSAVREIEYTLRLKEGLATLRDRQQLDALMKARRWRWALPLSVAAAVAGAALGTWTWYGAGSSAPVAAGTIEALLENGKATLPLGGKYMLVRVRSAEQVPLEIPLPAAHSAVELQVLPAGGAAAGPYRLVLERHPVEGKPKPVAEVAGLMPGSDGLVAAWLDSERIQPGQYTVELSSERGESAAPAERFVIELR
ncbi:MAG: hypothetical protein WDO68_15770 [Gammaproteobacteria bacterium]